MNPFIDTSLQAPYAPIVFLAILLSIGIGYAIYHAIQKSLSDVWLGVAYLLIMSAPILALYIPSHGPGFGYASLGCLTASLLIMAGLFFYTSTQKDVY